MENKNFNMAEVQKALDEANVLIKQLRNENEELQGKVDGLAKEKWEKMENQIKSLLQVNEKLVARVVAGENQNGIYVPEEKKQAFITFLKGGRKALTPEQKKALVEDSTGEILVPEDLEKEIIQTLATDVVMRGLCQVVTTGSNRIRKISMGKPVAGWGKLETGATLSDSTPSPSEATNYIEDLYALIKLGEDILDDSYVNLRSVLSADFSEAFAEKEEEGFIVGTGHANEQPDGLFTGSWSIGSINSGSAGTISLDDIINLYFELKAGYQNNATWLMNTSTALVLAKLKDSNGQYLWQSSTQAGRPNLLYGKPVRLSEFVPEVATGNKAVVIGDFKRGARIYDRLGLAIQVLSELYAENGEIGYKARKRVGFAVRRAEAFKFLTIS